MTFFEFLTKIPSGERKNLFTFLTKFLMSMVLVIAGLVLIFKGDDNVKNFGCGVIGAVVGFWMK